MVTLGVALQTASMGSGLTDNNVKRPICLGWAGRHLRSVKRFQSAPARFVAGELSRCDHFLYTEAGPGQRLPW